MKLFGIIVGGLVLFFGIIFVTVMADQWLKKFDDKKRKTIIFGAIIAFILLLVSLDSCFDKRTNVEKWEDQLRRNAELERDIRGGYYFD